MMDPQMLQQIMANQQQMQSFQQQFQMFQQQFQGSPQQNNYQSMVQGMMNNGTMSQQQFEQCRQMANMLTGKNY